MTSGRDMQRSSIRSLACLVINTFPESELTSLSISSAFFFDRGKGKGFVIYLYFL